MIFFFSSRRRHTRWPRDWSSDVCSSDLHPLPDPGLVDTFADRGDGSDDVGSLDPREGQGGASSPPGGDFSGVGVAAVGAFAHPHVGVVHPAGVDVDQHLPRCRVRCGHVLGVVQLVQAAVAHQLHGAHGGWNRHRGLSSPRNTRTRDAADEDRLACRSVMRLWGPPPAGRRPVDSGWEHECDTLAWALRRMLTKGSGGPALIAEDRKSTRLNSSHVAISYAVFCLKKKKQSELRRED